jgi:hypothetical protein
MIDYIKTEHPDYVRDPHSKALIFNNNKAVDEYTLKTKMFAATQDNERRINSLESKMNEVIDVLKEIKTLLGSK